MIDIQQPEAHFLKMIVSGIVTESDIEQAVDKFRPILKSGKPVRAVVDMADLEGITIDAISRDVQEGVKLLRYLGAPMRFALVTDHEWIAKIAKFESFWLPNTEIRTFTSSERKEADEWAAQEIDQEGGLDGGLAIIETDAENVLAFQINGTVTNDDLTRFRKAFDDKRASSGKIRLLNKVKRVNGVDPYLYSSGELFKLKADAIAGTERYAVVGGPHFVKSMLGAFSPFLNVEIRHFEEDEEAEAWDWIGAKPIAA